MIVAALVFPETSDGMIDASITRKPAQLITRLNQDIVRILNRAEVKERLFDFGTEGIGNSPEEFAATIKFEMAAMGKLIRDVGIHAE